MPKMKTNKAAAKRFFKTGSGGFKHSRMNKQHILGKKSPKRKRKLRRLAMISKADTRRVRRMLPNG